MQDRIYYVIQRKTINFDKLAHYKILVVKDQTTIFLPQAFRALPCLAKKSYFTKNLHIHSTNFINSFKKVLYNPKLLVRKELKKSDKNYPYIVNSRWALDFQLEL